MRRLHLVVPETVHDPQQPSGGNSYDARVAAELARLGWTLDEHLVPGTWPEPDGPSRLALSAVVAKPPDKAIAVVDGLLASQSPEIMVPLARRLNLVVLVHLPLESPQERAVLSAAAHIIATSEWTRDRLVALHGLDRSRVHVAEPGADRAPVASGTANGGEFLCVAAVTQPKGHDLLVSALGSVHDLPWRLVCAGPLARDPDFADLVKVQARSMGIGDRIRFVGPLDRTALEQAYAAADVLVHPSRIETYGMVVTEALAHGLPVIGTAVGGLPAALGYVTGAAPGVLVAPDDAAALAAALRGWLTDPEQRNRLRDRARVRRLDLSPWSRTGEQVSAVLESLQL